MIEVFIDMEKITTTNRTNNMVNYSIEEADAALDTMIETTLSEFNATCDEIDDEVMSVEEAKSLTIESVRKIYKENNQ